MVSPSLMSQVNRLQSNPASTDFDPNAVPTIHSDEALAEGTPIPELPTNNASDVKTAVPPTVAQPDPQPIDNVTEEMVIGYLQQKYGIQVESLGQAVEQYQQAQLKSALDELRDSWGVDQTELTRRLTVLANQFGENHPEASTVDGVKRLWASTQKAAADVDRPSATSGTTPANPQFLFTQSQLRAMSEAEYAQNADKILAAMANGQVDMDR